jgi:hypothetical protein
LVQKSINSTTENENVIQKTQIEWERLNVETNERLYVLQRAHTLYSEIEVLRKRVETAINRVDMIFKETIISSNSFHLAKDHLNKLKVIKNKFLLLFYDSYSHLANRIGSTQECRT